MVCKCGHKLEDHKWKIIPITAPEPCEICDCNKFMHSKEDHNAN